MSGHSQFALLRQRRFLPFFVTQSLGAFNDNVFRQATIVLMTAHATMSFQKHYASLAPALFILPYFFFSGTAGQLADRFEKSFIIRCVKIFEILAMCIAAYGFYTHQGVLLLVVLFMMGMHSTMFGPIKYSMMPQVLHPQELVGGNGLVETGTALAILIGMMLGGGLALDPGTGPLLASIAVIAIAIFGLVASLAIPPAPATSPDLKLEWNPFFESWRIVQLCMKQRAVFNSVLGISWFWFFGTALTAQFEPYAKGDLGGSGGDLYLLLMGVFSVGTGIGSLLCEKLSGRTVEIGLVPLGAIGISVFTIDLFFANAGLGHASGLHIMGFVEAKGSWRILLDLTLTGVFGGFFLVPLFALVQNRSPRSELSRVIAGNNIINSVFIVAAAGCSIAADTLLHWTIPQFFLAIGILNAVVAIYIFSLVPEFLMRFLSWMLIKALYRLRVEGIENIPDDGPALLVCNHVSYIDALLIGGAVSRPARFVMYYKIFNTPGAGWVFRAARAIPIAGAREDAALMERAFADVDAALAAGELVCIFPEGALTRDGEIAPFKAGVERILAKRPVPVVPLALRGMWTSMWSTRNSRMRQLRMPRRFRAHIALIVGAPVAADQASAATLEARVRAMRGDAA